MLTLITLILAYDNYKKYKSAFTIIIFVIAITVALLEVIGIGIGIGVLKTFYDNYKILLEQGVILWKLVKLYSC